MLQESPLYAYFPARNLDRARRFYEETRHLPVRSWHRGFSVPDRQRRHLQSEPDIVKRRVGS
jgi:hypothetical protein